MTSPEQVRFISLSPPTPSDAGERYLAFLQEELSERGKTNSLLAVYATREGQEITLWTFFAEDELQAGGPELDAVDDAQVKIKAGYFTTLRDKPGFSMQARAIPAKGRGIKELEKIYLAGADESAKIFLKA